MSDPVAVIRDRMRAVALGILATLNSRSFSKYRVDFPTLLVERPLEAYKLLLETYKSRERVRIILRTIILPLARDPIKAMEAISALERGDEERFKTLLGLTRRR